MADIATTETKPAETVETKPAETQPITDQAVIEKVQKGEELSPEETEQFKGLPAGSIPRPGETPAASTPTKTEDKKPETSAAASTETSDVPEERRKIIEAELNKPDHLIDLSKFKSPVELGLYWDLKKSRRKNQKLEEELEVTRIERIVDGLNRKKETKSSEPIAETIVDPLKDRDPDDIVTVEEARRMIAEATKTKSKPAEEKPVAPPPLRTVEQIRIEKVEADAKLRSTGINDLFEVVDFAEAALKDDDEAIEILRDTAKTGGNTVEKTYWLIKGSKTWPEIEKIIHNERVKSGRATTKPAEENINRAKKLEENDGKTRTTGAGSGASVSSKEYSVAEISSMTHYDIRKLPKETRIKILEKFGSLPNYTV